MELLKPLADTVFPAATVSYSGDAGSTSTWAAGPQGVVVWSTTPCYVVVGEGVTLPLQAPLSPHLHPSRSVCPLAQALLGASAQSK